MVITRRINLVTAEGSTGLICNLLSKSTCFLAEGERETESLHETEANHGRECHLSTQHLPEQHQQSHNMPLNIKLTSGKKW